MSIAVDVPKRLYPLRYHPIQHQLKTSKARFCVVPAGRRSGKTENAKRHLYVQSLTDHRWPDGRFFAAAPTRDQAKAIYWNDLKMMYPRALLRERPRETELMLKLITGAEVWVIGLDKPERMEGRPWNGGIVDEIANTKPGAWGENIRPALSDRKGWCWLIGVPEGRNHYYQHAKYAMSGIDPEWAHFTWPSADILDPDEVASARRSLDPLVFAQEYEASFVNFTGRTYYPYLEATHAKRLTYRKDHPIALCFDFNVAPGVCAIVQEQRLPGIFDRDANGIQLLDQPISGTGVIGEVWIPQNSTTEAVCRRIIKDWGEHKGSVTCFGDATGGAQGSAKLAGSDWEIIEKQLRPVFRDRLTFDVPSANPTERSRVNAMNSRLMSASGVIRMMVDPVKARHVSDDLEGVRTLEGGSGEIDKKSDPGLTHISDALGYYIVRRFPIGGGAKFKTLRM